MSARASRSCLTTLLVASFWLVMAALARGHETSWQELIKRAEALRQEGQLERALQVAHEALKVAEETFGATHAHVVEALTQLATLEISRQHPEAALLLLQRALRIDAHTLHTVFPDVSAAEQVAFLHAVDQRIDLLLSLRALKALSIPASGEQHRGPQPQQSPPPLALDPEDSVIVSAIFAWSLWVGYALEREGQALAHSDDHPVASIARQRQTTVSHLTAVRRAGLDKRSMAAYSSQLRALEAGLASLEEELSHHSEIYATLRQSRAHVDGERIVKILWPESTPKDVVFLLTPLYRLAAGLYRGQGNAAAAVSLYDQLLAKWDTAVGPEHPLLAPLLANIAELEIIAHRPHAALSLLQRALRLDDEALQVVIAVSPSEQEQRVFLHMLDYRFELFLSLVAEHLPTDQTAVRMALDATLRRKGVILDARIRERHILAAAADPALGELATQRQSVLSRLAGLQLAGPGALSLEVYSHRLMTLHAERERLETELARHSQSNAVSEPSRHQVDAEPVAKALEPGSALVEYVVVRRIDFDMSERLAKAAPWPYALTQMVDLQTVPVPWGSGSYWYLAFVLPAGPTAQPVLVDLGAAAPIDHAVHAFHQQMVRALDLIGRLGEPMAEGRLRHVSTRLYQQVFGPLHAALGNRTRLYLSPDGALNLIPFEVLADAHERYLVETHLFNYLSSGRDVLRFDAASPLGHGVVVVADPDYDRGSPPPTLPTPAADQGLAKPAPAQRSSHLLQKTWARLPGTREEAAAILKELRGEAVTLYEGVEASEELLIQLKSPRILHLATHGFFLPAEDNHQPASDIGPPPDSAPQQDSGPFGPPMAPSEDRGPPQETTTAPSAEPTRIPSYLLWLALEEALQRSGVALAGANHPPQSLGVTAHDGILTALEVSGLHLGGTELVVLSACDTGAGEASQGEGVFGLRRTFQLAGARTVIMSLWPIPDAETVALMTDFYRRLKAGIGKAQALREAALAQMQSRRQRYGAAHPFFWGAFVALGDPGGR